MRAKQSNQLLHRYIEMQKCGAAWIDRFIGHTQKHGGERITKTRLVDRLIASKVRGDDNSRLQRVGGNAHLHKLMGREAARLLPVPRDLLAFARHPAHARE